MTRRMSPTRRARIFADNEGFCHLCGTKIDGVREAWEVEHVIPLEISGDDSDGNLAPAHVSCHKVKTKADARDIAKCKRVKRKHEGAHRPKATLPGSRGSKWKRTVDGRTVLRNA